MATRAPTGTVGGRAPAPSLIANEPYGDLAIEAWGPTLKLLDQFRKTLWDMGRLRQGIEEIDAKYNLAAYRAEAEFATANKRLIGVLAKARAGVDETLMRQITSLSNESTKAQAKLEGYRREGNSRIIMQVARAARGMEDDPNAAWETLVGVYDREGISQHAGLAAPQVSIWMASNFHRGMGELFWSDENKTQANIDAILADIKNPSTREWAETFLVDAYGMWKGQESLGRSLDATKRTVQGMQQAFAEDAKADLSGMINDLERSLGEAGLATEDAYDLDPVKMAQDSEKRLKQMEEWEGYRQMKSTLEQMLGMAVDAEGGQDNVAKWVASPNFQAWAADRGFRLGRAVLDKDGNVVSYAPSSQDIRAIRSFLRDTRRGRRRLTGDIVMVQVQPNPEMVEAHRHSDGRFAWDPEIGAYYTESQVKQMMAEAGPQVEGVVTARGAFVRDADGKLYRVEQEEDGTIATAAVSEKDIPEDVAWAPVVTVDAAGDPIEFVTMEQLDALKAGQLNFADEAGAEALRAAGTGIEFTDIPPSLPFLAKGRGLTNLNTDEQGTRAFRFEFGDRVLTADQIGGVATVSKAEAPPTLRGRMQMLGKAARRSVGIPVAEPPTEEERLAQIRRGARIEERPGETEEEAIERERRRRQLAEEEIGIFGKRPAHKEMAPGEEPPAAPSPAAAEAIARVLAGKGMELGRVIGTGELGEVAQVARAPEAYTAAAPQEVEPHPAPSLDVRGAEAEAKVTDVAAPGKAEQAKPAVTVGGETDPEAVRRQIEEILKQRRASAGAGAAAGNAG